MNRRWVIFLRTYVAWVLVLALLKPVFMLVNRALYGSFPAADWLRVVWHGLPLDCSLAGYLTAIPGLLLAASVAVREVVVKKVWNVYMALAALTVALTAVLNAGLYGQWGFPLDTTPFYYFFSSPKDALASVPVWMSVAGLAAVCVLAWLIWLIHRWRSAWPIRRLSQQWRTALLLVVLTALLFLPIRGGVTVASMNTGRVYFSPSMPLNHAAVDPLFSLMEALTHKQTFSEQYAFLSAEETAETVGPLLSDTTSVGSREPLLGNVRRPDIVMVVLESFSRLVMQADGVTPELNRLTQEGVDFVNFHANSFRTDRGLVSIFCGYPALPTASLMKYPRKIQQLPSLVRELKRAGYGAEYYYGGDADFANKRSFLVAQGFDRVISDKDFALETRLSKWGTPDHLVARKLLDNLRADSASAKPMIRVLQTLSSHEPFDVPFHRLADERLNAFAYTDSVAGALVEELKRSRQWENTLLILVADHQGAWPQLLESTSLEHFQIPMIWTGGAISAPRKVETIGSQQDILATLLGQLGLKNTSVFSKDLLDSAAPHFAFFTVPDVWGMVTRTGWVVFDNKSRRQLHASGERTDLIERAGKAYLQTICNDIDRR